MRRYFILFAAALAGCPAPSTDKASPTGSSAASSSPRSTGARAESTASAPPSALDSASAASASAEPKDERAAALAAKGTACGRKHGGLDLDCKERKELEDYAFQNQNSEPIAATCTSLLADKEPKVRLMGAACLFRMTSAAVTPHLGAAMDAIEAETDDEVRTEIAWGIKSAEAVTAKLEARVLALVKKLAADPKKENAASHLVDTLFPQYMMGSGPKPPPEAQAYAIEMLSRDGTPLQHSALNAIGLLEDKQAACAALEKAIRPEARHWTEAALALADLHEACASQVPHIIDLALADPSKMFDALGLLRKFDRVFELEPATRKKIAGAAKGARAKSVDWQHAQFDETIKQLEGPRPAR